MFKNNNFITILTLLLIFIFLALLTYFKTKPFTLSQSSVKHYSNFYLQRSGEDNILQEVESNETEGSFVYVVQFGDTFESIFSDQEFNPQDARKIVNLLANNVKDAKIYAGQKFDIHYKTIVNYKPADEFIEDGVMPVFETKNQINILQGLKFANASANIEIKRKPDGEFEIIVITFQKLPKPKFVVGSIKSSLYQDAIESGISPNVIESVIRLYSFDVDFQRDIREGDSFEVLFEEIFDEKTGIKLMDGNVIYSKLSLTKDGKAFSYYFYKGEYYDDKGKTGQKSFLKTPVPGARLSSRFGARRHPILGFTRMHTGIDFAAPRGTPIFAAATGVVEFAGWNGGVKTGYGRLVIVRHNSIYTTRYAHMHGFRKGIKTGSKVRQGEVIGYVGSTGYATGPHLHYEVLKNGKFISPNKITAFSTKSLSSKDMIEFLEKKQQILGLKTELEKNIVKPNEI